jgi:hypothetical protein
VLQHVGRLDQAAALGEQVLERFRLPAAQAAAIRARNLELRHAVPPPLRPPLRLDPSPQDAAPP